MVRTLDAMCLKRGPLLHGNEALIQFNIRLELFVHMTEQHLGQLHKCEKHDQTDDKKSMIDFHFTGHIECTSVT